MGFFTKLFSTNNSNENNHVDCQELLRFISFAQKVKPLMGGNYGITVTYNAPDRRNNEYIADIIAEFGFYDFDEIHFARDYAVGVSPYGIDTKMVHYYYRDISDKAGLTRDDWPYRIEECDFASMLTNCKDSDSYALIPDPYNDDIFKIRINAGFASQNGIAVSKHILQKCREMYPNLKIDHGFAYDHTFEFTIRI